MAVSWRGGANYGGQLGTGNTISTNKPVQAGSFTNAIAVAAGTNFSLALTRDGSVWAWGTNNVGQLGLGNTTSQLSPVKITTLSNIVQIAAGSSHCLALGSNGVVYASGVNALGQLGDGTTGNWTVLEIVPSCRRNHQFGGRQMDCRRLQQFRRRAENRASVLLGLVWKRHD